MEDPQSTQRINENAQSFSLLDVSNSDDDFLLDTSSAYSLLDTKASAIGNQGDAIEGEELTKQPNPIELQRPKKSGKCNLRKSLAWDSAFFTSAGVLEPEELSSIMEEAVVGVQKKPFLPGIQEDISKSTDSISTFESDLTLESIEADLFSDIRASIQRCTKSSTQENGKDSTIHGGGSANRSSPKVAETSSGDMAKSKLPPKKLNSVVQSSLKSPKPNYVSKQVTKPGVRSRESSSSLPRRPVAAVKPSLTGAVTIKRMSVGAGRAKSESNAAGNLKAGKAAPLQKAPLQSDKTAPKQVDASPLPSMCSTRSSRDSSSSSSSDVIHKTRTDIRKKTEKNSNLPLGSKTRLPSRVAVRNKPQSGNSNLSNYLKSTTKPSPSISSASSISEWSIDSCSSTATVEQRNTCSKDHNVNKRIGQNLESGSNYEAFGEQFSVQVSMETKVSHSNSGLAKPSGLRMPSAKIGFFDGVKTETKTPVPTPRSRSTVTNTLPRSTTRISLNKTKLGNTSAKVTPITAPTAKPEPSNTDTDNKPAVHIDVDSTDLCDQRNKCEIVNNDGNQHSSLEVGEVHGLKVVESQACNDACAKDRVGEKAKCMEAIIDSKLEKNKKEDCDSQSHNVSSNEKRTPFAVKNIRPDIMETCGLLSDSVVDMVVKDDVMPCQHEGEKENI